MSKIQLKVALIIAACYLFTVCIIYKCMPMVHSNASNDIDFRHIINNATKKATTQNVYKLNWNEKDHMFFKRVRNVVENSEIAAHPSSKDSLDCDVNTINKFRRISAGIYIYSAYFDKRNETAYIRMIAAVSKEMNREFLNATLSCVFNTTKHGETYRQLH